MEKNSRKREILALLAEEQRWLCSSEVADKIGISLQNASTALRHYHSSGLVKCRKVFPELGGFYYEFELGSKGAQKLSWLRGRTLDQELLRDLAVVDRRARVIRTPAVVKDR